MDALDLKEIVRMGWVYTHLLAMVAAGASIAFADYALLGGKRLDKALLKQACRFVLLTLLALWASGLAIIWVDTHFVLGNLLAKPKLLAKLSVVTLLTLNGLILHHHVFNKVGRSLKAAGKAEFAVVLGAISTVSWLYAAFLGLAGPLVAVLGYSGFMAIYAALLVPAIAIALLSMPGRLRRRMDTGPLTTAPTIAGM